MVGCASSMGTAKGGPTRTNSCRRSMAPGFSLWYKRFYANPKDPFTLGMHGLFELVKLAADSAIKDFDECIRLDPKDAAAHSGAALPTLTGKNTIGPSKTSTRLFDSTRSVQCSTRFEGVPICKRKTTTAPSRTSATAFDSIRKDVSCYLNRGYAYLIKKDYDRAIKDFDETIRLDPKIAQGLQQSRLCLFRKEGL